MVTFFKDNSDKIPFYKPMDYAFERIKTGKSKEKLIVIRNEKDKEKRNDLKSRLPSVLFSGKFKERTDASLEIHSSFVILDFDQLVDPNVTKNEVFKEPFIKAVWISPSGNGVKALAKIKFKEKHRAHYKSLMNHFKATGISPDEKNINESRLCYESWDENILIKDEVSEYTQFVEENKYEKKENKNPETNESKIYEGLKKWAEKRGEYFIKDNRNNFVMKLACACNRTGIDKHIAIDLLANDFAHGTGFSIKELQGVVDRVYKNYSSQFNTNPFENDRHTINEETFTCDMEVEDLIYFHDVFANMEERISSGIHKGETTHFPILDEHFRWTRREVTVINGYGNHGKSTMAYQLMLMKSIFKGFKWAIFNPENSPADMFYQDIAEMHCGKRFDKSFSGHATDEERKASMKFIDEHFFYIYPKDAMPTPEYMLSKFMETIIKHNVDGVCIDPFNQLVHDRGAREDHYLEMFFNNVKRFTQNNNIFFLIITHPKTPIRNKSANIYDEPTAYEISGGAMWNNKPDNMLCYNRPNYFTNPKDAWCTFSSQRIRKQKLNGVPGKVNFTYDVNKSRFFEHDFEPNDTSVGFNPLENKTQAMKPNINFYEKESNDDLPFF